MPETPPQNSGVQRGVGSGSFEPSSRMPLGAGVTGVGGAANPGALRTLDGLVTNLATSQRESERAAQAILVSSERTARMMGSLMDKAHFMMGMGPGTTGAGMAAGHGGLVPWAAWAQSGAVGITGAGANYAAGGSLTGSLGAPTSVVPLAGGGYSGPPPSSIVPMGGGPAAPPPSSLPPGDPGGSPRRPALPRGVREGAPPSSAPPGGGWPTSWEDGRSMSIQDIRTNVASRVNQGVSEWARSGYQQFRDADTGQILPGTRPAPIGSNPFVKAKMVPDGAGGMMPEAVEGGGFRYEASSVIKNVAGEMAGGKGLGEALTSAVPKLGAAVGVAGAAYMAVNRGLDFAEDQRTKNMEFQSVLGGSNAEGFSERMRQNVFRLSMRGTMGGADAEQIYKSAMENYGTDRTMRGTYQDAALNLYRGSGLSAGEGTRLLDKAAGQGNDNLLEFAGAIREVGKAAREAGESAADGRKFFEEGFDGASGYATGSAQIGAATSMSKVRSSLGDQFSDTSFSGMDNEMQLRMMAQGMGMSYGQFVGQTTGNQPGGSLLIAQGRDALVRRAVTNVDPTGSLLSQAERAFSAASAGGTVTDAQINQIASDLYESNPGLDPTVLAANMRMAGIDTTDADAMALFLRSSFGDVKFAEKEKQRLAGMTTTVRPGDTATSVSGETFALPGLTGSDKASGRTRPGLRNMGRSKNELGDTKAGTKFNRNMSDFLREQYGMDEGAQQDQFNTQFNESSGKGLGANRSMQGRVRNSLLNQAMDTGTYNSMGQALWSQFDQFKDSKFVVQTKDGERAVDAYELVENYSDQLQANPESIRLIGGQNTNKTVGDVLGVAAGDASVKVTSSGKSGPVKGEKVSEAEKKADKEGKEGSGRVEIVAEPWLKNLLSFKTSGSAYESYSYGEPPTAAAVTPPEGRQSGTGD